tara:strand:- start:90 stop:266 length:177 start_codon:yes stop_codon:yes gene_type:complete
MGICQSLKVDHQLTAEEVMILLLGEYFIDPEIIMKMAVGEAGRQVLVPLILLLLVLAL